MIKFDIKQTNQLNCRADEMARNASQVMMINNSELIQVLSHFLINKINKFKPGLKD